MNPLFVLRRVLLLLCLLGAQHVALVHAYEHHPAPGVQSGVQPAAHPVSGSDHGSVLHAVSCADCLAGHALNVALPVTLAALRHAGFSHVFGTAASVLPAVRQLPERRAHGPPLFSLI